MTDHTELKRLAEAAPEGPWFGPEYAPGTSYVFDVDLGSLLHYESIDTEQDACLRYVAAANPAAVLGLIADLERNQRMLLAAACDIGAIGKALKADMNADGDELLGMVIDLKAQNTRMMEWLKDISRTSGDKGAIARLTATNGAKSNKPALRQMSPAKTACGLSLPIRSAKRSAFLRRLHRIRLGRMKRGGSNEQLEAVPSFARQSPRPGPWWDVAVTAGRCNAVASRGSACELLADCFPGIRCASVGSDPVHGLDYAQAARRGGRS